MLRFATTTPLLQQPALPPRPAHRSVPEPAARSLAFDIYRGLVWGDFDQDLGVAGALAPAVVGFIPVLGTLAALRDLLACLGQRDLLGIVLNLLAIFPVLGGLAKTADALHTLHRYHRATQRRARRMQLAAADYTDQVPASSERHARRSGCAALGLSLLVTGIAALYGLGVRTLLAFLWTQGPTIHGYVLHGQGAWIAPLLLLPLGLIVGLVLTVRGRLWLGLLLLPAALALGFAFSVAA
jgi:hypothetical protein